MGEKKMFWRWENFIVKLKQWTINISVHEARVGSMYEIH